MSAHVRQGVPCSGPCVHGHDSCFMHGHDHVGEGLTNPQAERAYDPHDPPLMGCGHTANATLHTPEGPRPSCVICMGIKEGATVVVERPSLEGRLAVCSYSHGGKPHTAKPNSGPIYGRSADGGTGLDGPVESSWSLPFFSHKPDAPYDEFYCGCWGWD